MGSAGSRRGTLQDQGALCPVLLSRTVRSSVDMRPRRPGSIMPRWGSLAHHASAPHSTVRCWPGSHARGPDRDRDLGLDRQCQR